MEKICLLPPRFGKRFHNSSGNRFHSNKPVKKVKFSKLLQSSSVLAYIGCITKSLIHRCIEFQIGKFFDRTKITIIRGLGYSSVSVFGPFTLPLPKLTCVLGFKFF